MSNYTNENLINISPNNIPAGTLAMKVGENVFTAGSIKIGSDVQLGQIIEKDGVQKFVPMVFNGTEASEGTAEEFTDLYTYNTANPIPEQSGSNIKYYKCASVDTVNGTWSGYEYDPTTQSISNILTENLEYGILPPTVGKYYTEDGMIEIDPFTQTGLVFYAPLISTQSRAETGQNITTYIGGDSIQFQTYQKIHCAYFNGNSRIDINDKDLFPYEGDERTFSGFINLQRNSQYNDFFSYGRNNTTNGFWALSFNNLTLQNYGSGATIDSEYSINLDTWYHICVSYKEGTTKFYVNGLLIKTSSAYTRNTVKYYAGIGASFISPSNDGINESFQGYISEVKVYNRALSQSEITAEYNRLQSMIQQ